MSCDGIVLDQCIDPDEDWITPVWLQSSSVPDPELADLEAWDLTGLTLVCHVWFQDVLIHTLTEGDGIAIGGVETAPKDDRGRATGSGTRVDLEMSEADIQALSAEQIAGPWEYKLSVSGPGISRVLLRGQVTVLPGRPR